MLLFGLALLGGGIGVLVYFRHELRPRRLGRLVRYQWRVLRWLARGFIGNGAGPNRRAAATPDAAAVDSAAAVDTAATSDAAAGNGHETEDGFRRGAGAGGRAVGRASVPAEGTARPPGRRPGRTPGPVRHTGQAVPPPSARPGSARRRTPPTPHPRPRRTDGTE